MTATLIHLGIEIGVAAVVGVLVYRVARFVRNSEAEQAACEARTQQTIAESQDLRRNTTSR